jgi:hypothetical protein
MSTSHLATPAVPSWSEGLIPAPARGISVRSPLLSCGTSSRAGWEWAAPISRATQATGIPDQPIRFPFESSYGLAHRATVRNANWPTPGSGSVPHSWEGNRA